MHKEKVSFVYPFTLLLRTKSWCTDTHAAWSIAMSFLTDSDHWSSDHWSIDLMHLKTDQLRAWLEQNNKSRNSTRNRTSMLAVRQQDFENVMTRSVRKIQATCLWVHNQQVGEQHKLDALNCTNIFHHQRWRTEMISARRDDIGAPAMRARQTCGLVPEKIAGDQTM